MEMAMMLARTESGVRKILENIIFLADVFAERVDGEIPDVPFLDLARSFELKNREDTPPTSRGGNE
ncbi:MAG: hypothetical protein ACREP8_14225 [Candidatus Binatia bacterium]